MVSPGAFENSHRNTLCGLPTWTISIQYRVDAEAEKGVVKSTSNSYSRAPVVKSTVRPVDTRVGFRNDSSYSIEPGTPLSPVSS